jgi:hypothetical protein
LPPGIPVERGHAFRLKAALMAVIDHFEEIAALVAGERGESIGAT